MTHALHVNFCFKATSHQFMFSNSHCPSNRSRKESLQNYDFNIYHVMSFDDAKNITSIPFHWKAFYPLVYVLTKSVALQTKISYVTIWQKECYRSNSSAT